MNPVANHNETQVTGAPAAAPSNPFGDGAGTGRRRAFATGGGVLLIAAALGLTMALTRGGSESSAAGGHNHGAAPTADVGMPVALTVDQAARIGVTYAVAERTPIAREIRTVGQVTFDETRVRTISPKVEGWVERLYVNYTGQPVSAGQPLLAVYSPMLVSAQEELLLAARLVEDVNGGSEDARRSAEELLASARRRLAYWDVPASEIAAIERSGQVRRTLTLHAPHGGHVLEKRVSEGQKIMMGDALYKVADLGTIWVEGEVFEQDLSTVRRGQHAIAEFDAVPGRGWQGRITYVYPTVDPETRTARVRVELANPGLQLKPGMYATLRIAGNAVSTPVSVPRAAVLATGRRALVFVRRADGKLEPREVTVGSANDDRIAILNGLAVGETVVASATFLVDAESNLGSLVGGMGNMPGMDMSAPVPGAPVAPEATAPAADPHAGHTMPAADPHAGHQM